eukprot:TRINITY_DN30013_c0_g1_i1.p1 TRINITY_DN30013_c0_g1~~TRINITY_DN30013_c0_g1_i1.p1  ORF type:complete len:985 (+),score=372.45 TRINITY_DN30013_c0_g1_i1:108-3062(+)
MSVPEDLRQAAVQLLQLLQGCTSNNTETRRAAEAQLNEAAKQNAFFTALFFITADPVVEPDLRVLAAITIRTFLSNFWRAPGVLPDATKHEIKQSVLHLLKCPEVTQMGLVKQVATIVAKVSRFCLSTWPELLQDISAGIQHPDHAMRVRYYLTLRDVLREGYHVMGDREPFFKLCELVSPVINKTCEQLSSQVAGAAAFPVDHQLLLECCWTHKVMCRALFGLFDRLATSRTPRPDVTAVIQSYSQTSLQLVQRVFALRQQSLGSAKIVEQCDRILKKAVKSNLEAFQKSPKKFAEAGILGPWMSTAGTILQGIANPFDEASANPFLLLQCLTVVEHALSFAMSCEAVDAACEQFFTEGVPAAFATVLLDRYLPMTPAEMSLWCSSPEEYVEDSAEGEESGFDIKSKACSVFASLAEAKGDTFLGGLTQQLVRVVLSDDRSQTRAIEVAYHALGLCCYSIPDSYCDADSKAKLLARALSESSGHPDKIVRRRAVWFLGQWLYTFSGEFAESLPSIMKCLVHAMGPVIPGTSSPNDVVIQLTALNAFQEYLSLNEFEPAWLSPEMNSLLHNLFYLLNHCKHTGMHLGLDTLGLVVSKMGGAQFRPHIEALIQVLNDYCMASLKREDRGAGVWDRVLQCLSLVVRVLGTDPRFHSFVCTVIKHAADVNNPDYLELIDQAIVTWYETLVSSPQLSPQLVDCFALLPPLSDKWFAQYETFAKVVRQYLIVGGSGFMAAHTTQVVSLLHHLVSTTKDEALLCSCGAVDDCLVLFPERAGDFIGLLTYVASELVGGSGNTSLTKVSFAVALCRFVVACKMHPASPESGAAALAAIFQNGQQQGAFIDLLADIMDDVSRVDHRKLFAAASLLLLTPPDNEVISRIDLVMMMAVAAVQDEEMERTAPDSFTAALLDGRYEFILRSPYDGEPVTKLSRDREELLMGKDFLFSVGTRQMLAEQLKRLQAAVNPSAMHDILAQIGAHNRQPLGI